jgi:uncharacterized protein YkwD
VRRPAAPAYFRPLLRKGPLLVLVAGFFLLIPATGAQARTLSGSEASLLRTMNSVRTAHGLAPLRLDVRLVRAARGHSADMIRRQYFAHGALASRALATGARGPLFGENLAWGAGVGVRWVVEKWLESPSHRAVLLRAGFRRVGIGISFGAFAGRSNAAVFTADFAGS